MAGKRIVIVGGGYTGCALAIQLSDAAPAPLDITLIEPQSRLGAGFAYDVDDPDHRLNAPTAVHFLSPDRSDEFYRWFEASGGAERDPEATAEDGGIYARREDFGRYVAETTAEWIKTNPSGSTIRHLRDRAVDLAARPDGFDVTTEGGERLAGDLLIVATGNRKPLAPPPPFRDLEGHPGFVMDPWDTARLRAIPESHRVLFLGTALTTADVIATLIRRGHRGQLLAISRRGLLSRSSMPPASGRRRTPLERIASPVPDFLAAAGDPPTLMALVRQLRAQIRKAASDGIAWNGPFDDLRDSVWQIWPRLSTEDKFRFLRHVKAHYDVHRFRVAPQTEEFATRARVAGQLTFEAAHGVWAEPDGQGIAVDLKPRGSEGTRRESFHTVINCTGLDGSLAATRNPFLRVLLDRGFARVHPVGFGFDLDATNRPLDKDGKTPDRLFIIGPPAAASHGDPIGAAFIASCIWRIRGELFSPMGMDAA